MKLSLEHREEHLQSKKDISRIERQCGDKDQGVEEDEDGDDEYWREEEMRRTRVRVSDERARLEWLATWNMGHQSTLIYSQSQMGTGGRRRWRRRWFTKSEGGKQLEKFSKWVTLTHSSAELVEVTRAWKDSYTIHTYCHCNFFDAHKITAISRASSKRLDVRNWTFLMRRLCCSGSQSNWHNCKLPPNHP